jgi:hypothetical protein
LVGLDLSGGERRAGSFSGFGPKSRKSGFASYEGDYE